MFLFINNFLPIFLTLFLRWGALFQPYFNPSFDPFQGNFARFNLFSHFLSLFTNIIFHVLSHWEDRHWGSFDWGLQEYFLDLFVLGILYLQRMSRWPKLREELCQVAPRRSTLDAAQSDFCQKICDLVWNFLVLPCGYSDDRLHNKIDRV